MESYNTFSLKIGVGYAWKGKGQRAALFRPMPLYMIGNLPPSLKNSCKKNGHRNPKKKRSIKKEVVFTVNKHGLKQH